MARLPNVKRINREEVKEAPSWIGQLLAPLNQFMSAVYLALAGQLTFTENIRASIKELSFTTASDYTSGTFETLKFPHNLRVKAQGVLIVQLNDRADSEPIVTGGVSVNWLERSGQINVRYVSGLSNSTDYVVRFLVF